MILERIIAQSGDFSVSSADRESREEIVRRMIVGVRYTKWAISHYQATMVGVVLVFSVWHGLDHFLRSRRTAQLNKQPKLIPETDSSWKSKARVLCRERLGSGSSGSSTTLDTLLEEATRAGRRESSHVSNDRTPLLSNRERKPTALSRIQSFLMYQPPPIPVFNKILPENASTLLILALFGVNVFYTLIGIEWELPLMLVFSDRTSLIFAANLPWLYILGAKNQPLRLLTGYSYEHLNILHRRLGEWLCFVALLHTGSMFMVWYWFFLPEGRTLQWFLTEKTVYIGLITLACYEVLYATSLASFRKWWYELFLALHIILQAGALGFLYFHHRGAKPFVRVTLAIFLLDRLIFRLAAKSRSFKAELKVMPDGNTVLLSANWPLPAKRRGIFASLFSQNMHRGWGPAEHVFITVPSLGRKHNFQAHPFTIASAAPHPSHEHAWFNLIIRALDGFTRDLLIHAHTHSSVTVRLDGPYGSSHALDMLSSNDVAITVVGGSGIAVAYPMLWALLQASRSNQNADTEAGPRSTRKVCLIWIVHQEDHISWLGHERLDELAKLGLHIVLPPPTSQAGRPDVSALLRETIEDIAGPESRVGLMISGPDGMNRAARNCCAELVGEGRKVEVAVEKFGNGPLRPNTPLNIAIGAGRVETVNQLLQHGAKAVTNPEQSPTSPLLVTLSHGHQEIVSKLLDHGALPNKTASASCLLWTSIQYGNSHGVKFALSRGIDPNQPLGGPSGGFTAVHWAVTEWRRRNFDPRASKQYGNIVEYLIQYGADPGIPDSKGRTAEHYASVPSAGDASNAAWYSCDDGIAPTGADRVPSHTYWSEEVHFTILMDPASAIGVAAAAVEFFAIGVKAIRLCKQIHDSAAGATQANEELEASIHKLNDIRDGLNPKITLDSKSDIAKTQKECLEISKKLSTLLEGIKASSQTTGSRGWKEMSATWRAMRAKGKIEKLETKLEAAEGHFKKALTVDMRNAIEVVLERQEKDTKMLDELCEGMQKLRPEVQQIRQESKAAHSKTHEELAAMERKSAVAGAENVASHQTTHSVIGKLGTNMETQFENAQMSALHREILGGLEFPEMFARQQDIKPPAEGTFEWVFTGISPYEKQRFTDDVSPAGGSSNDGQQNTDQDSQRSVSKKSSHEDVQSDDEAASSAGLSHNQRRHEDEQHLMRDQELRARLLRWLTNDDAVFWVNGKAGSGKSSLMSYVANDDRTIEALRSWAGDHEVHLIKFFFWRPGSQLQKSIPGLLRSILYQLLRISPGKIDDLLADGSIKRHSAWAQIELLRALKSILQSHSEDHICFFIDGLDEHEGDYMGLLDILLQNKASSNLKTCLASRPEPEFVQRLRDFSSIRMQDLNQKDIETLVCQKLKPLEGKLPQLAQEVTSRAKGVFLWAALVCSSLVAGHAAYDDEEMLEQRLNTTPSGLRELFEHMFSKIDDTHRMSLMMYCHLLKWASEGVLLPPNILLVTAALNTQKTNSVDEFLRLCEAMERQVAAQSKGLIEVIKITREYPVPNAWSLRDQLDHRVPLSSDGMPNTPKMLEFETLRIQWVHRTAHDCIFDASGERLAAWILSADVDDLRSKITSGSLWLAQWAPTTRILRGISLVPLSITVASTIFGLARDISKMCSYIGDTGYHALDEILDLLISSLDHQARDLCRKTVLSFQLSKPITHFPVELVPLCHFWIAVSSVPNHPYLLSRFDRLESHPGAAIICTKILRNLEAQDDLHTVDLGVAIAQSVPRLLSCISRGLQFRRQADSLPAKTMHNRHWEIANLTNLSGEPKQIVSWVGNGEPNEVAIMIGLLETLYQLPWDRVAKIDYLVQVHALLDSRQTWMGLLATDEHGVMLPTQLLWPTSAVVRPIWQNDGGDRIDGPGPDVPRLVCVYRLNRRAFPDRVGQNRYPPPEVVSSIEMSDIATAIIKRSVHVLQYAREIRVEGSPAEFNVCLQTVLDDIWTNANHELNAWQQLYALACVKTYFKKLWRFDEDSSSSSSD
ncbi:hypothetical protein Q7P37_004810 [Cladosporium fusiforme]